jgi:membrane protein implicated in regulation of membrane protease activity
MSPLSFVWLIAAALLYVVEGLTFNLVTVWFAVGCTAALLVSFFTGSFTAQFTVFILFSILCLLALRPLVQKLKRPATATNGDRNIGRTATVVTPVSPQQSGRVRLDGVEWNARSNDGRTLQPGEICRIVAMQSTLLIVEAQPVSVHT